jgi:hypothetical protein
VVSAPMRAADDSRQLALDLRRIAPDEPDRNERGRPTEAGLTFAGRTVEIAASRRCWSSATSANLNHSSANTSHCSLADELAAKPASARHASYSSRNLAESSAVIVAK